MSHTMRKPSSCIWKNKGQLCANHVADQHICFRYIVQSLYFPYPKFQASRLYSLVCEDRFSRDEAQILKELKAVS